MKRPLHYDKWGIDLRKTCGGKHLSALALLSQLWICELALADVWEYRHDGSVTVYRMPDFRQRAILYENWRPLLPKQLAEKRAEYRPLISDLAFAYVVDDQLVHAIVEVESAYDAKAVSKTGAMGLMQLMPKTAERFAVIDPLDPEQNVEAGIRYIVLLEREFERTELILAAYNAGEEAVRRYDNSVPPYAETRAYIERVLAVLDRERPDVSK